MEKLNEKTKNDIWEKIINPEIKKRGSFFLLLALCSLLVAGIAISLGKYAIAMTAIIALMINMILWSNGSIIRIFYNQGEYGFVSLILNYHFSDNIWEYWELKKQKKLLLTSTNEEDNRKEIEERIRLLKIWINQIK